MALKKDETDFLIGLGKNIAQIRKEKSVKQTELAYMCDMEKSNLIRIEKGRTNPTTLTLRKLSKALKISVKTFFEGLV